MGSSASGTRALTASVLGARPLAGVFTALTQRHARILAYHGIDSAEAFRAQLDWLTKHCRPVASDEVARAVVERTVLPPRAVWVTFDDASPDVVEIAAPLLAEFQIRATVFVCPAVVATDQPYWWQVVDDALAAGIKVSIDGEDFDSRSAVTRLKRVPDERRRAVVEELRSELVRRYGKPPVRRQISLDALRQWVVAGHSVGSHSWDHPCLDRCDADEQMRQVELADRWLEEFQPDASKLFAYPNGDWTPTVEDALRARGYEVGVLFDHRLARLDGPPFRISRLRVSTSAPVSRLRAIVSGAHPALFHAVRRGAPAPGP